jgi:hypothetical protein
LNRAAQVEPAIPNPHLSTIDTVLCAYNQAVLPARRFARRPVPTTVLSVRNAEGCTGNKVCMAPPCQPGETSPHLVTPSVTFFSPSFQPVPDLNIGLPPGPMLYLKSEMHNPSRPRGPSAYDALPLPEPNESVPLAGSAASPVDLRTITRFASQNLRRSAQPILDQLLTPTPVIHTPLGFCVTKAPFAGVPNCTRPTLLPWKLPLKWTRKT